MNETTSVWSGIYSSFDEASKDKTVYEEETWQNKALKRLEQDLGRHCSSAFVSPVTMTKDYPFSTVAAMLYAERKSLKILDFGGGLAPTYLAMTKTLPENADIEYHIVDNPNIASHGRRLLQQFPELFFHSSLPLYEGKMDIALIASTLHYIEDWKGLLKTITKKMKPDYLVLTDLLAGNIPTFVSTQAFYGKHIPVWFWNIEEFLKYTDKLGFELIYKSLYQAKILGKEENLPMEDLPKTYRLKHTCNLILKKKTD